MPITLDVLGLFLWRSSLLILIAFVINATLFRRCPAHRYAILLTTLLAFPILWLSVNVSFDIPMINEFKGQPEIESSAQGAIIPTGKEGENASHLDGWISLVWAVGLLFFLFKHLGGQFQLNRLIRNARVVKKGHHYQRFKQVRNYLKVSPKVQLMQSDELMGPAAAGVFSPRVLIPSDNNETADETLIHEILHHRRRDLFSHHLAMFIRTVFWFHPLAYLLTRTLSLERERAVDLKVVEIIGDSQRYIERLRDSVMGGVTQLRPETRASALLGAPPSQIRRRIEMLLKYSPFKSSNRPVVFAISLVFLIGLISLSVALGACTCPETLARAEEPVLIDTDVGSLDDQGN